MRLCSLHKTAGLALLGAALFFLSACSPADFTTVVYVTPPPAQEASPFPGKSPVPFADPAVSPESPLPPEPSVEPHDYSLPAPETEEVDVSWFADAVFLGDSRTDGLRLYGGVTEGDFICYKGLMCRDFSKKVCITSGGEKITAKQALEKKQYGKIFVMLGLNELDFTPEVFAEDFSALIDGIREVQPEATLYFQSLVPINDQKAREKNQPKYVTNEKIALFNAEVSRITQEKQVILVDVAEGLTDEEGILPYDATHDGVHFNRSWYEKWFAYLKTHTVDPQRLEAAQ